MLTETNPTAPQKILYIDMDNTLVDFASAFPLVDPALLVKHEEHKDDIPGIFALMQPLPDESSPLYKRLILSHHKNLNRGDFLVDDRPHANGVNRFHEHGGEVIHFGPEGTHQTWPEVVEYLEARA